MCRLLLILHKKDGWVFRRSRRGGREEMMREEVTERGRKGERGRVTIPLMEQASAMLFPLTTLMSNLKQFKSHFGGSPSLSLFSSVHTISLFLIPLSPCLISVFLLSSALVILYFSVESGIYFRPCVYVRVLQQAAYSSVLNIQSKA